MNELEELKEHVKLLESVVDKVLYYLDDHVTHNTAAFNALDELHTDWLESIDDLPKTLA